LFGEEPRVGLGTSRESSAQCRTALGFIYFGGRQRGNLLAPGEDVKVWGSGVLWRPSRQYWLAKQFPFLKLVWPMKVYSTIVTDRGRLLLATYTAFGGLADKEGTSAAWFACPT